MENNINVQLFGLLASNVHSAVVAFDGKQNIIFANEQFAILLGVSKEHIVGEPISVLAQLDFNLNEFVNSVVNGMSARLNFKKDFSVTTKNLTKIKFSLNFHCVESGNEGELSFFCIVDEISSTEYFLQYLFAEHIRYQEYLNDMPLIICRYDMSGIITYSNKFYYSAFGSEKKFPRNVIDDFNLSNRLELQDKLFPLQDSSSLPPFEIDITIGGEKRWMLGTTQIFYSDHAKTIVREYQLVLLDTTAQKQAEIESIDNQRKMYQVIDAIDDAILVFDANQKVALLNKAAQKLTAKYHLSANIRVGERLDLIQPNLKYPANDKIIETFKTGLYSSAIYAYYLNEQVFFLEHRFFPIISKGKIEHVLVMHRDQTFKRMQEMRISRNEMMLNTIVENAVVGIINFDVKGNFIFVNTNFAKMMGYTREELIGLNVAGITYHADLEVTNRYIKRLIEGRISHYNFEKRFVKKDGSVYWAIIYVSALRDSNGRFISGICINQDITKRKQNEKKLKQNEENLAQLIATKDKFFSIIAHDVKGPFATISLLAKNSPRKCPFNDKCPNLMYMNLIKEASDSGYNLLSNLLLWAKDQTGLTKCKPETLNLKEIVSIVIKTLAPIASAKMIVINNLISEELNVYADRNMLRTIFRNLISNAIKYSNRDGHITCYATSQETYVEIQVIDNGVGISKDDLKNIFKIDGHVSTKGTNNEDGTGLGLVMCREFVEKNGGKIWVSSTLGKGSVFSFKLPIG